MCQNTSKEKKEKSWEVSLCRHVAYARCHLLQGPESALSAACDLSPSKQARKSLTTGQIILCVCVCVPAPTHGLSGGTTGNPLPLGQREGAQVWGSQDKHVPYQGTNPSVMGGAQTRVRSELRD